MSSAAEHDAPSEPDGARSDSGPRRVGVTRRVVQDFLRSPAGNAAVLGFVAGVFIVFGGFGAGSVRREDPLLEQMHLSWLRFGHGFVISMIFVWLGVLMMIGAWVRLGRSAVADRTRPDGAAPSVTLRDLFVVLTVWTAPLLLAPPMFSRDAFSYLAQGALLRDGFDPYKVGPVVNPGILLDNVSNVWTTTTAPYGPAFLLLGKYVTMLTGDNVVTGTWLLRLTMLPGLVLTAWAVPRLARRLGGNPVIALWLAVLNPLVLIHLIGGVHNEVLMVGLMAAGIVLVLDGRHVGGIAVITIGAAVKATAGLALPFMVWIWMCHERERAEREGRTPPAPFVLFVRCAGIGVVVFAAILAAFSLFAGVGIGWLTALSGSQKIINWLSLPTMLAHVVTWVTPFRLVPVLEITRMICAGLLVVTVVWVWWRSRHSPRSAVLGIVWILVALTILSPAALPWYYSWPLAIAAAFALSPSLLAVLVGLSTWLMLIFNPDGSIGMYNIVHVALATFAAVVAGKALRSVDPLRLRSGRT